MIRSTLDSKGVVSEIQFWCKNHPHKVQLDCRVKGSGGCFETNQELGIHEISIVVII